MVILAFRADFEPTHFRWNGRFVFRWLAVL